MTNSKLIYPNSQEWLNQPNKRISLFGMSGVGKTYISNILRNDGSWFHYSVDYRIGTHYMGELISDNLKLEAMRNYFLKELLRSDSISIESKISFSNLEPLSTYLGKPGNKEQGGIPFSNYMDRQRHHKEAEINALNDTKKFIKKSFDLYGYNNFICDTSGSICELVDPTNSNDKLLKTLSEDTLLVWVAGNKNHKVELLNRFVKYPKPIYYNENFVTKKWNDYLKENGVEPNKVDPNQFISSCFKSVIDYRIPIYEEIAKRWGIKIYADDLKQTNSESDFVRLIAKALNE